MTRIGFAALLTAFFILPITSPVAQENMRAYEVVNGTSIPQSLTGKKGDWKKGRTLFINSQFGNCVSCHNLSSLPAQSGADQPNADDKTGPTLDGIGSRLSESELRLIIVDPQMLDLETTMPSYHRVDFAANSKQPKRSRPILSPNQIEDLIAYLTTLE